MNIGILTQYYPPEIGAPQSRLSHLARELVAYGHNVVVLTAMPNYPRGRVYDGYGGFWQRDVVDEVPVLRSYIYPSQSARLVPRLANYFSFVCSSAAAGAVRLPPLDYLLTENPPLFLGLSGFALSRLKGARWIFNVSDLWPESAVRIGVIRSGSLSHRLSEKLEAWCYRRAWLVTGQSRSILADISARFPECQTFHLSNGADTTRFHPDRRTSDSRAVLGADDACVALYAGLHGLAQGLDQLLDAAEVLGERGPEFVFIGDGPVRRQLIERAEQRNLRTVRFLPARPAADIPGLVAAADIVVVTLGTYIPGAVPSKLYEAMASGRPVILVASGEAADIVRDHNVGIVVEPGDTKGLSDALMQLRSNAELRATLGANGRRAAEGTFDRVRIIHSFIKHLEFDHAGRFSSASAVSKV
jgi:glycosyltransferase involved in cell wall biosynthesis